MGIGRNRDIGRRNDAFMGSHTLNCLSSIPIWQFVLLDVFTLAWESKAKSNEGITKMVQEMNHIWKLRVLALLVHVGMHACLVCIVPGTNHTTTI